jgi:hypothetical protein
MHRPEISTRSLRGRTVAAALAALALAALPASAAAQGSAPASPEVLSAAGLADGRVVTLDLPADAGAAFSFALELEGAPREIHLQPYSVRAEGYELRVRGPHGIEVHPPTVETSYRGQVEGHPQSLVAVNLFRGQLQGILRLEPGAPWYGVQPVSGLLADAAGDQHLVYLETQVLPMDVHCGGAIDVLRDPTIRTGGPGGGGAAEGADGTSTKICEIAIDSDVEFFQKNQSSVPSTENDITNVINAVEAIYESDADVLYDITVIYVETAEPDPYSTSSAGSLLDQFQNHWNSQHQGDQRDVAHLFTGKNIIGGTIGIAYLNVICNKSQAYGLSESKFTGSFTFRVGLTAHELGHNWSASHCDGAGDCWIMCSGIGGCAGSITKFGSQAKAKITNKKATSACLETAPPPSPPFLTGISPGTTQAFQGAELALTGFFLEDVTQLNVGDKVLSAPFGFQVESDGLITFHAPIPSALGAVQVTASNGAGTSNPLSLTYVETSPPKITATGVGLTGLAFNWNFGAESDGVWFLFVSLNDPSTVPFAGFNVLANSIFVTSDDLNAVGIGSDGILMPPGAAGATLYSQALILDGTTFAFEGATNVATSSILF